MDQIDATILHLLQADGRMKCNAIAERVGLSVPATAMRMRKLEQRGVITGYHAAVSPKLMNYHVTAFITVSVETAGRHESITRRFGECDEILEAHAITGIGSHLLKVVSRDTQSLEVLLGRIQAWPGVVATRTSVVLNTYKASAPIRAVPEALPAQRRRRSRALPES